MYLFLNAVFIINVQPRSYGASAHVRWQTNKIPWSSVQPRHCPLETLSLKFKATAKGLQSWSQKKVGHLKSQLAMAKEIIHQLDIVQDSLKKHTLALSSLLRTVARIRSRIGWLKDGDANTRLFHMHARHRKRKNFIAKLEYEDRVLTGHDDKAAAILDFYSNLIGTEVGRDRTVDLDALEMPNYDLEELDNPILEQEI